VGSQSDLRKELLLELRPRLDEDGEVSGFDVVDADDVVLAQIDLSADSLYFYPSPLAAVLELRPVTSTEGLSRVVSEDGLSFQPCPIEAPKGWVVELRY